MWYFISHPPRSWSALKKRLLNRWWPYRYGPSYALHQLDYRLTRYLRKRNGVFIEAGGHDGLHQSNTLMFERRLGWRGMLIEPNPELYKQCAANRPDTIVENCALVSDAQACPEITLLMADVYSAVQSEENLLDVQQHTQSAVDRGRTEQVEQVRVSTARLSDLIDQHKLGPIDLLSLDVEGFEVEVMKGIDFDRHRPQYILVECRNLSEISEFLITKRYEPIDILSRHDVLYTDTTRE